MKTLVGFGHMGKSDFFLTFYVARCSCPPIVSKANLQQHPDGVKDNVAHIATQDLEKLFMKEIFTSYFRFHSVTQGMWSTRCSPSSFISLLSGFSSWSAFSPTSSILDR
ncbi:hypothetical protein ACTXT7_009448 [Hymenolepis weldensis]